MDYTDAMQARSLVLFVLLTACGPGRASDGATSESDSPATSTTDTSSTTTTSSSSSSEGSDTDTGDGITLTFVPDNDLGSDGCGQCDMWAQDCPEGEKCMHVFSEDGSSCRSCAIAGNVPVGAPCEVQDWVGNCDEEGWCYPAITGLDEASVCVQFCGGNPDNPQPCDDPGRVCVFANFDSHDGAGCLPRCAPLDPNACPEGQRCTLGRDTQLDFGCMHFEQSLAAGEPCRTGHVCASGVCVDDMDLPACTDNFGCCADVCDTLMPDCPLGTECVLIEVETPNSTAGVCRIPD